MIILIIFKRDRMFQDKKILDTISSEYKKKTENKIEYKIYPISNAADRVGL